MLVNKINYLNFFFSTKTNSLCYIDIIYSFMVFSTKYGVSFSDLNLTLIFLLINQGDFLVEIENFSDKIGAF